MVLKVCPRCNQRISINFYDVDYVHKCNSGIAAVDNEDVVVNGDYIDEVTGNSVNVENANFQGMPNKLWPKDADLIDNEDNESVTKRGNRKSTHRTRQHYEYVRVK